MAARDALAKACDRLAAAMDTDPPEPLALPAAPQQAIDGGPAAEARALPDLLDAAQPLDSWLAAAA